MKDHKELHNKTNEHFKDKASISGSSLPTVASCLSRCARSGLSRKGHVTTSRCNQSLQRPHGDNGMSELDT